jgi:hypothetical protein
MSVKAVLEITGQNRDIGVGLNDKNESSCNSNLLNLPNI